MNVTSNVTSRLILLSTSILTLAPILAWGSPLVWENEHVQALRLEGSIYDRARTAAEFAGTTFEEGIGAQLARFPDRLIDRKLDSFQGVVRGVLEVQRSLLRNRLTPEDRDFARGIADGFGSDETQVADAFLAHDFLHIFISIADGLAKQFKASRTEMDGLPLACSSFSTGGIFTETGERIIGRSFDNKGIGTVDRGLGVYLIKAENGRKVLALAPRGLPLMGIAAMNESGLVLNLHSVLSRKHRFLGSRSILTVNREVMTHARTIEEAVAIYRKYKYMAGWLVHLSDRDPANGDFRSAVIEINPDDVDVMVYRNLPSVLTNHYRSEAMKGDQAFDVPGMSYHNEGRLRRLTELTHSGALTPLGAVRILQDAYDAQTTEQKAYSTSSIRAPDQISAFVFRPDSGSVWISEGKAPTSLGRWWEFSFKQMDAGKAPRFIADERSKRNAALDAFVEAYKADTQDFDDQKALVNLILADAYSPDCSFKLMLGSRYLMNGFQEQGDFALDQALACAILSPYQRGVAFYLAGLVRLERGKIEEARARFKDALKTVGGNVRLSAEIKKMMKKSELDRNELSKKARIDLKIQDIL